MSKQNRPLYMVSTDSIGLLGSANQFLYLWREYIKDLTIDGVEIIAFGPLKRLNKFTFDLKSNNVPILSFHGQTGDIKSLSQLKRLAMIVINTTFISAEELLVSFGKETDVLFHTTLTEINKYEKIIIKNPPKKLWIENNPSGELEVDKTINQINNYRGKNINAFGLFDVFHYVRNLSTNDLINNWVSIVKKIEYFINLKDKNGQKIFTGLHFPIGTRLTDSLPIEIMNDDMLKLFGKKIIPHVERVVFENQQKGLGMLYSTPTAIKKQKIRNTQIIERFKKTGIIPSLIAKPSSRG